MSVHNGISHTLKRIFQLTSFRKKALQEIDGASAEPARFHQDILDQMMERELLEGIRGLWPGRGRRTIRADDPEPAV